MPTTQSTTHAVRSSPATWPLPPTALGAVTCRFGQLCGLAELATKHRVVLAKLNTECYNWSDALLSQGRSHDRF